MISKEVPVMYKSSISDFSLSYRGKVRDIYDVSSLMKFPALLIITTDRISAFDRIFREPIPLKGYILNQLTLFWFDYFRKKMPFNSHLITADINEYPKELTKYKDQLRGRSMIVHKYDVIPIECVVREYLTGSAKEEYDTTGKICGINLPRGLVEMSRFKSPIFTPATKASEGEHDRNIDREEAISILDSFFGKEFLLNSPIRSDGIYSLMEQYSINLFKVASNYMREKGIILIDAKKELAYSNIDGGYGFIFCDEAYTPDCIRACLVNDYVEGMPPESLDKQIFRDYLKSIGFIGDGSIPELPTNIIAGTTEIYNQIHLALAEQEIQY